MQTETTPKKDIVQKGHEFLARNRVHYVLLTIFLVFGVIFAGITISAIYFATNPEYDLAPEYVSRRQEVITSGEVDVGYGGSVELRTANFRSVPFTCQNEEYKLYFSPDQRASDYMAFNKTEIRGKYSLEVNYAANFYFGVSDTDEDTPFSLDIDMVYVDGTPIPAKTGEPHDMEFTYVFATDELFGLYDTYFELEVLQDAKSVAMASAEELLAHVDDLFAASGFANPITVKKSIIAHFHRNLLLVPTLFISSVSVAIFLVLFGFLFGASSGVRALDRALSIPPLKEVEEAPVEIQKIDENAIHRRIFKKLHLRPIIEEWPIRIVGLSLLAIASVFTILSTFESVLFEGTVWVDFFNTLKVPMNSLSNLANFILAICIVNIIAESHERLYVSAYFLFALATLYYVVMSFLFFYFELIFPSDLMFGALFLLLLRLVVPGNIFMGVGIFCFVGLFLFAKPPRNFINRKVFRALAAIPTVFAIFVIVMSMLFNAGIFDGSFWVSNLFFIKDPMFIIVGIGYEYIVFIFRHRLRRHFGDVDEELEKRDDIQLMKNILLVGLIILIQIAFYCIPAETRKNLGFPCLYSIIALSIPLFLLQKPKKGKRKIKDDLIYYGLFFLFSFAPMIFSHLR